MEKPPLYGTCVVYNQDAEDPRTVAHEGKKPLTIVNLIYSVL